MSRTLLVLFINQLTNYVVQLKTIMVQLLYICGILGIYSSLILKAWFE